MSKIKIESCALSGIIALCIFTLCAHAYLFLISTDSTATKPSHLVCLLAEHSSTKLNSNERNLALQLSRLMGVSDSIDLARELRELRQSTVATDISNASDAESLLADLFTSRKRVIRLIVDSFKPEVDSISIRAPSSQAGIRADALLVFHPYQRFYTSHQVELAAAVQGLRHRIREGISQHSPETHQLAELDRIVDQSLAVQTRKLFNVAAKLLEQRFEQLRTAHLESSPDIDQQNPDQWLQNDAWLGLFYNDMRELLLAELDVRLQPVLGLIEALNEHRVPQHD